MALTAFKRPSCLGRLVALAGAVFGLSFTPEARADPIYEHDWCFRWRVNAVDNGVGEDFGTSNVWLARGARVFIWHPSEASRTLYTDVNTGCISFVSFYGSGFELAAQHLGV